MRLLEPGPQHQLPERWIGGDALHVEFRETGECFWGEAPREWGVELTSVLVAPLEDPDNGVLGWLQFGVGLFTELELVAAVAWKEPYPLRVRVPPRQSFFVKAAEVDTPFEARIEWKRWGVFEDEAHERAVEVMNKIRRFGEEGMKARWPR